MGELETALIRLIWKLADPKDLLQAGVDVGVLEASELKLHKSDGDCFYGNRHMSQGDDMCFDYTDCWYIK